MPKKSGRTNQFRIKDVQKALEAAGGFVSFAAKALHCSTQTVRNYINKHTVLQDAINACRVVSVDKSDFTFNALVDAAYTKAKDKKMNTLTNKEFEAMMFNLRCHGKGRGFSEKVEQELVEQVPITFQMIPPKGFNIEQLRKFYEAERTKDQAADH